MNIETVRQRGQAHLLAASQKTHQRLTNPSSWRLPKQKSSIAPPDVWTNADQDPVPPEKRTWTRWTMVTYWISDIVTISTWEAASSVVTTGLSATDAVLIVMVAGFCNAIPTAFNGCVGSDLHIPFPVAIRASFGYWLSYFCILSRGVLAMFWFGIQSASGGNCVTAMIAAIWPSYNNLPNTLPSWVGITSQGMVSYLIYWLIQFPLLLIPTYKLQYLFNIKTVLIIPVAVGMVIYVGVTAGSSSADFFHAPPTVSGSTRAWLWLTNLTSVTGGFSTLTVNIPDFTRFSKHPNDPWWQIPIIPLLKTTVGLLGIVAASASQQLYGETLWNPIDIINKWTDTSGGRAAAFFCAAIWLLAQISVNISANAISFANDLTSVAPKYINIRRGTIIVALLGGWALCPWTVLASAQTFLAFMSAYAIFMAPIAGILLTDYWIVTRRKYDVPALYDPRGIYRYTWGCNWRALATTLVIIVPLLPALGHNVNPGGVSIPAGLAHLFSFNWLYGFFSSIVLYWVLNYFFPHKATLLERTVLARETSIDGVDWETGSGRREDGIDDKGVWSERKTADAAV